jgi:nucleotide-binding universal stress UspA family protein
VTDLAVVLAAALVLLGAAFVYRSGFRLRRPKPGAHRILVPFTGGTLDPVVLNAALRLAQAEAATFVPAYILIVPLRYSDESPLSEDVAVAMPLLEAVERAAIRAGVPVDARIERGRSLSHALRLLWEAERFDRIVVPAAGTGHAGFTTNDIAWLLANAPAETIVLKPYDPVSAAPASPEAA